MVMAGAPVCLTIVHINPRFFIWTFDMDICFPGLWCVWGDELNTPGAAGAEARL
jgi:hypothetical protein